MMKRTSSKTDAAKRLLPLGAVAIAAGCGGGAAHNALPAANDASSPTQSSHATTTAMLTVRIPARGTAKSKRAPKYISQGSAAIGYAIAASGATPPAETVTALPSPGPVATSVTLPVTAPVGTDTVSVHIYDAVPSPGASATPNVLSEGSTTAPVAVGQSSPLNVEALGVAAGVQFSGSRFEAFENHPQPQSTTLTATPVDADGYTITGTLASAPTLSVPAGMIASPAAIAAAGSVTITYPANSTTPVNGIVTAGLPLDTVAGSTDNLAVGSTQYAFIASNDGSGASTTITAIDPVTQAVVGATTYTNGGEAYSGAAVAGCTSGETLVSYDSSEGKTTATTFGAPSTASAATPTVTDISSFFTNSGDDSFLASDANCGVYSAADTTLTRYSGFPNVVSAPVTAGGWQVGQNGNAGQGIVVSGSTIYNTYDNAGYLESESVPLAGGTTTQIGELGDGPEFGLYVGGAYVYDSFLDCSGTSSGFDFVSLPDLSTYPNPLNDPEGGAVGSNNTIYQFDSATGPAAIRQKPLAAHRTAMLKTFRAAHPASASHPHTSGTRRTLAGTPPAFVTVAGTSVGALSSDGRYLVTDVTCAGVCVQIYTTSTTAGGAPTPVGSPIPLASNQTNITSVYFPH